MEKAWQLETEKLLQYISPILPLLCFSVKSFSLPHLFYLKKKNLFLIFIFLFLIIIRLVLGVQVVFIVHLRRENHSLTKANTHTHTHGTRLSGQDTQQEAQSSHPSCHRLPAVIMVLLGMLGSILKGHKYLFFDYWSKFFIL